VTHLASQSITKHTAANPCPCLACQLVSASSGANDLHVMHESLRNADACIDIAGIHQMRGWEQVALSQVSVDGIEQLSIGNRCSRCRHVGDFIGMVFLTGFGEMNLVPRPSRCSLDTEARFHIMG
jgi:hypothetical protein